MTHVRMIHSADGTRLALHSWSAENSSVSGACQVLIVHGYLEHGGRYDEFAQSLVRNAQAHVTAVDLRGHGQSAGQRGYVAHFDDYLDDVQAAYDAIPHNTPVFLLGHSNGGLVALKFAHDRRGTPLQGLLVTSPFLAQTTPVTGPKRWLAHLAGRLLPRLSLPSGIRAEQLTHDAQIIAQHQHDPLIFSQANSGWFREAAKAQQAVRQYRHLPVPLLLAYSQTDSIASPQATQDFVHELASPVEIILRPTERHEPLNEVNRAELYTRITAWLTAQCAAEASQSDK